MRTALMYLVIGRLQKSHLADAALVAEAGVDSPTEPARPGILGEDGVQSIGAARRRRRIVSRFRVDPPEAAA